MEKTGEDNDQILTMPYLYSIFHCNLAFSSIPVEHFPLVVRNCYWPLLELCEDGFPMAIEMPAWTLDEVRKIDSSFVRKLSSLWRQGKCEFIGSGYSQAIFPLIPAEVNEWNLDIGGKLYKKMLGKKPSVAFVNEQTWSAGLAGLYKKAGYKAIIMEWNNCQRYNNYPPEYLYFPQTALGAPLKDGRRPEIPVIWNNSIAFQKLQRYCQGLLPEGEYLAYLKKHIPSGGAFPLYGNDAEIFDYRPGDESPGVMGEHRRMRGLLKKISGLKNLEFVTPSVLLQKMKDRPGAFHPVSLESAETPVPCKKQEKYNPLRWAVTGRDSVHVNTQCHRAFNNIKEIESRGLADSVRVEEFRKALCYLWSSDFRTTTTDEKFLDYQNRMGWLQVETAKLVGSGPKKRMRAVKKIEGGIKTRIITEDDYTLSLRGPGIKVSFLKNKGLAIKELTFPGISPHPLLGTLEHGYYEDIELGADFFSGHLINVQRDGRKVTDLVQVRPEIEKEGGRISITGRIPLEMGILWKRYEIDLARPTLRLTYDLKTNGLSASSLRLGIFTFFPHAFHRDSLFFEAINGGSAVERTTLKGHIVAHDKPVSPSISASSCLGATEGWVSVGDRQKKIIIRADKARLFSVPMVRYQETERDHGPKGKENKNFFFRIIHSIGEVDDTAYSIWRGHNSISFDIGPA